MSAEEMGKLTNRTRLVFAVSSVVFLAVLAARLILAALSERGGVRAVLGQRA